MGRKFYLPFLLFVLSAVCVQAQTGEIRGRITEKGKTEGVAFASVAALLNGEQVQAAIADIDGNYSIKPLNPGTYEVKATNVGYQPAQKTGVIVSTDKITFVDLELATGAVNLEEVVITEYEVPLTNVGTPTTQKTVTHEEIQQVATRSVNSIASTTAGVFQRDDGDAVNIRGTRDDATVYYIDGIKVIGSAAVSQAGTEQITVMTGGIPARYGDATGGIISITTRGPASNFAGGVEFATSELFDDYGYNLASFNLSGPIIRRRDTTSNNRESLLGFFVAGEYQRDRDPNPPAIPVYVVKDDILESIRKNPLVLAPNGNFIHRAHYFTMDSLSSQTYRENNAATNIRLNGKLDIRPIKNVTLTFGGTAAYTDRRDWVDIYSLMNFDNNPQTTITNWRAYGKITQRFGSDTKESTSNAIKNAFYSLQVDYSRNLQITQNADHKDDIFRYGHIGKFRGYPAPVYSIPVSTTDPLFPSGNVSYMTGFEDTLFTFEPGNSNEAGTNYTSQYYALTDPLGTVGYQDNFFNVVGTGRGLGNDDNRIGLNVYGLWALPGRVNNSYTETDQTQLRLSASGSADIGNHNIVLGLEYEQRTVRGYTVNPNSLWAIMRQLGNQRITQFDTNSAYITSGSFFGLPTEFVNYSEAEYVQGVNADQEPVTGFYENIRNHLGLQMNDTIQTDSYDPSTYSLSMFAPDELILNGLVDYYGYDYTGVAQTGTGSWDLRDFYVNKDENNNFLREIDAFRPTYIAGYIEDKFTFNDIIFNVGVRVDRFDANQKVLADPYLLYDAHEAGDAEVRDRFGDVVPSGIGDDFVVYVNNSENPSFITGYRNGTNWYDASGNPITDIDPLTQAAGGTGGIQPFLTNYDDYDNNRVNPNAFTDYEPQVNVMPRVAFSFPISDEAYFAAHYDVLTQRPQSSNLIRFNPITYLNWSQGIGGVFRNPNLKPERTTDYEITFQQRLTRSSAITINAFYKEMRDNIQIINVDFAYPVKYQTYGNVDFGTVKGLTFGYDLRRTTNVRMGVNYTLQFAEGTGSDPNTNFGVLSQAGQTNLREVKPLDFDQRHIFVTTFDYRYGSGKSYNGPVWFGKQFFANAGLNLIFRAGSGTPYTRKSNITPEADFTTQANSRSVISGSLNGSRYPWQFRIDAKIDKDFEIKFGKKENGEARKSVFANVYLQVYNLLDTRNVVAVYAATGSPSDDGYIDSPGAQTSIASQVSPQAYIDLYRLAAHNPDNYNLPRRMQLGVQLNF